MEFTPEQKVLNDLFGNDLTYEVPSYQRPYSWASKGKSDKDNQVNIMWQDLIEHFESDTQNIYFIGSMVFIGDSATRTFQVVDGQQRLTTLTLLFVAIKCMLSQISIDTKIESKKQEELKNFIENAKDNINSLLFNKKLFGVVAQEKKVKIQNYAGFDYDNILKLSLECKNFTDVKDDCTTDEQVKVSERYFLNRDYFIHRLQEHFLDTNTLTYDRAMHLNNFIEFLKNKVTIVRILSPKFDTAYQIFEILNNRGLPLSNKDLFRNFIISEFSQVEIENPEQKWLALDEYEFTSEFISRYVESTNAKKQKSSAFNDLKEIYKKNFHKTLTKAKATVFYEDIEDSLIHFTDIELLSFQNKRINHQVQFLKNAGNSRYIVNLLLALFKNITAENDLIQFLSEFELFVIYLLLGPSKRFQVKPIFEAIECLNDKKSIDLAITKITLEKTEKTDLKRIIRDNDIKDNDIAKLMIARYLWAKDIDEPNDVVALNLTYKSATLEHIIPQTPDSKTNWGKSFTPSFRQKYTYKLGNMTLLTQRMNSKAKNYDFSKKKDVYKKMKLSITTEIGNKGDITEEFIKERHKQITDYLISHFALNP